MIVGDSPQSLIVKLSPQEAKLPIANRAAAGFNAPWVNLLCANTRADAPTAAPTPRSSRSTSPATLNAERAVLQAGGLDPSPCEPLWDSLFLDPIETGGSLSVLQSNGLARAFAYGQCLGKRYAKFRNIVWMSGNDFQ